MSFTVTAEQRATFESDGVVKLPGAIDAALVEELGGCFEWAVQHPGPVVFGNRHPGPERSRHSAGAHAARAGADGDEVVFEFRHCPAVRCVFQATTYRARGTFSRPSIEIKPHRRPGPSEDGHGGW